ncbi:hypothetical protein TNCV_652501 [Trichonephila clavipes]|nr:hypothetical protein TNCV_652501 [Trichonephila clavipes]
MSKLVEPHKKGHGHELIHRKEVSDELLTPHFSRRISPKKNPELTSPVKEVAKILRKWLDHRKIQLKLPYCSVMWDT